jgi:hypothetical protein
LAPLGFPEAKILFGPAFRIVPQKNAEGARIGPVVMMINTLGPGGPGMWSKQAAYSLNEEDISFHLLGFFNWRLFYWRDYSLYRVRIDRWKDHEESVGHDALIEVLSVDVLCDPSLL